MKNIILTIALVVLPSIALGAPQKNPSPVIEPGAPCMEACYNAWPECLREVADVMEACVGDYPGQFCEMQVDVDIRYRCESSVENCIQSCGD